MSDLMQCDRCQHLFNYLEAITRYGDRGQVTIETRICSDCGRECGLTVTGGEDYPDEVLADEAREKDQRAETMRTPGNIDYSDEVSIAEPGEDPAPENF